MTSGRNSSILNLNIMEAYKTQEAFAEVPNKLSTPELVWKWESRLVYGSQLELQEFSKSSPTSNLG